MLNEDQTYKEFRPPQLVNNEELVITSTSGLGLDMGAVSIAAIGKADDVALLSPHPIALQSLLNLSQDFSTAHSLHNVPDKTKLLVYSPRGHTNTSTYWQDATPITMDGAPLDSPSPPRQSMWGWCAALATPASCQPSYPDFQAIPSPCIPSCTAVWPGATVGTPQPP